MKITINDHRKIFAIQEEFNNIFPNLIIEFHAKGSREGSAPSTHLIKHDKTLGECRTEHNKGEITITPNTRVGDLKNDFRDIYGLTAEIFQKSENGRVVASYKNTLDEENKFIKIA
jgi:hypothetical protein